MKNLTNKQKMIRAIPGLIVGSIMIGIITWGISSDRKCKELLQREDCKTQMVFSYYSKERRFGNGSHGITTGYYIVSNNDKYGITTDGLAKPINDGTPIIVRYSPECLDCYKFLWDSAFVYNGYQYRYFYVEDEGYNCEITKFTQ